MRASCPPVPYGTKFRDRQSPRSHLQTIGTIHDSVKTARRFLPVPGRRNSAPRPFRSVLQDSRRNHGRSVSFANTFRCRSAGGNPRILRVAGGLGGAECRRSTRRRPFRPKRRKARCLLNVHPGPLSLRVLPPSPNFGGRLDLPPLFSLQADAGRWFRQTANPPSAKHPGSRWIHATHAVLPPASRRGQLRQRDGLTRNSHFQDTGALEP